MAALPAPMEALSSLWHSRWLVLVASFWLQACAGIGYAFGSFSPLLKSSLGYNQQQINILGNAKDIGDAMGLISGSLCDVLPTSALILIGALQNIFGYGWLWLIVTQRASVMPFWVVCALIFIGTNGETYFNTAALVTNVRNFPKSRGHVVGLLKGFTGLCGAIFTQIYTTFFAPNQAAYLFIVAVGPTMVAIFVMLIIRPVKIKSGGSTRSESIGFSFIYADCIVLAAYLMGVLIVQDVVTVSFTVSLSFTIVLLFLVFLPLATPLVSWCVRSKSTPSDVHASSKEKEPPTLDVSQNYSALADTAVVNSDSEHQALGSTSRAGSFAGSVDMSELEDEKPSEMDLLPDQMRKKMEEIRNRFLHAAAEGAVRVKRRRGPRRGEDFTLTQALVKADFWLLFWALVCGAGTGLTAIDNMGQISQSLGYSNSNVFVSMISIWNFVGRLIGGSVSEIIARDYALPRPWAMAASQTLMAIGHFLFAMGWPVSLYLGTLFVGIGYGSHWGIVPPSVSELFGMKYFGIIYNFFIMASPAGSLFFSGFLAGYIYDLEADKQQTIRVLSGHSTLFTVASESATCTGAVCFRLTFLIMTGVCLLGISLTTVLCIRTRSVYQTLYGRKESDRALRDQLLK